YRSSTRGSMNSYYLSHLNEITSNFDRFSNGFHERLPSYIEKVRGFTPAFVREPLSYRGGPLRYTSMASDHTRLIANLVGFAETLARSGAPHAANNLSHRNSIGEMAR